MYAEILSIGGHETRAVETAEEAIEAIAAARPEVIVLDLGIAGGVEPVLGALRDGGGPPVALILASGARDLGDQAAALGAAAYLQKPFGPEQLLGAVERVTAR